MSVSRLHEVTLAKYTETGARPL